MIGTTDKLVIRELASVAELKYAEELQRAVWGEDDPPDNSDILLAIQHEGGLVAGAFVDDRMLGFLFAFPTRDADAQHSHRLAVHPDSRGLGLGIRLKWFQRDWCLARGITTVRWTFDPLRRINASLNIARLGATAGTYYRDYYGPMVGINAGLASDRLLVEWALSSSPVVERARLTGYDKVSVSGKVEPDSSPISAAASAEADWQANDSLRIAIPEDLDALLERDLHAATAERLRVRASLTAAFDDGYRITGFDTRVAEYVLTRPR